MSMVGKNVDALCTRCGLTLAHIVLYEVGGMIARVKCKTCGAEHKYRGVKVRDRRGATGGDRSRRAGARAAEESRQAEAVETRRWLQRQEELGKGIPIRPYCMADRYQRGEVIDHPAFGIGFVEKILEDQRMDVLFKGSLKRMVMNMPPK
ncbi:MAG: hypothetical protein QM278_01975 [Pseudomonadota bacterium]|nr:hypothetical protein [Pseudomonadota bacterium]